MADLILLKSFYHRYEAEQAIGMLKKEGIEAFLQADDAGGFRPDLALGMGNCRVMIDKQHTERALEIIQPLIQEFTEDEMQSIEQMAAEAEAPVLPSKSSLSKESILFVMAISLALLVLMSYIFLG